MNWFIRSIQPGKTLPRFWGAAWSDYQSNTVVAMPVPLNLVFPLFRALWIFALAGWRGMHCDPRDAFHQGMKTYVGSILKKAAPGDIVVLTLSGGGVSSQRLDKIRSVMAESPSVSIIVLESGQSLMSLPEAAMAKAGWGRNRRLSPSP